VNIERKEEVMQRIMLSNYDRDISVLRMFHLLVIGISGGLISSAAQHPFIFVGATTCL
jgi:hypothetical protein